MCDCDDVKMCGRRICIIILILISGILLFAGIGLYDDDYDTYAYIVWGFCVVLLGIVIAICRGKCCKFSYVTTDIPYTGF
jgi:hypothetical protein